MSNEPVWRGSLVDSNLRDLDHTPLGAVGPRLHIDMPLIRRQRETVTGGHVTARFAD